MISNELDSNGGPTTLQYVIATHQRTKSSLLCKWLWEHGSFGLPWEYHYDPTEKFGSFTHPHNPTMFIFDFEKTKHYRTGQNGVFGLKTMEYEMPVFPMLDTKFFIYLDRHDYIARAISEFICDLSGQFWSIDDQMDNIPEYHQGVIKMKIDCYREQQTKWENYFKQNNITPLRLYSEELEQETTIKQIADYLGIDSTKQFSNPPFPDIQEQGRSEIIKEYKERFIKETNLF